MIQAELKKWVPGGIYRLAVLQELKKERAGEKRASKKEKKSEEVRNERDEESKKEEQEDKFTMPRRWCLCNRPNGVCTLPTA